MQPGRESRATSRESKSARPSVPDARSLRPERIFALIFGLFLGLGILKFGDPVILDQKIDPPNSWAEAWNNAWPPHWAIWVLAPIAVAGIFLAFQRPKPLRLAMPAGKWLWLLPFIWFGWQLVSATRTVDMKLTTTTLYQFAGCIGCYFLGRLLIGGRRAMGWLLVGVLAAFTYCLVQAVDQRLFQYPASRQLLVEGEREGWTNIPPAMLLDLKHDNAVITTNGMDVANPAILTKLAKGRVSGTMVYPNALAGLILLLLPVSLVVAFTNTRQFRPVVRGAVIVVAFSLGFLGLFWSGSKAGWLIAMALIGVGLLRLNWSVRLKQAMLAGVLVVGLAAFAIRFHNYFAAGATSVGARFDYWRAAAQTTARNPLFGTGPGTFQRPYARIKAPQAEMARLAHNDYLQGFSDSGIPGGTAYLAWVVLALAAVGRAVWRKGDYLLFGIFVGLLGWFAQGLTEFGLYIPALAWTAFALLGGALSQSANQVDKEAASG